MRIALFALFASILSAATLSRELTYNPAQFSLAQHQTYDVVLARDMDVTSEPGAPQLPVEPVVIVLDGRCQVNSVTFETGVWEPLPGRFVPFPAQKQRVLVDTSLLDAFSAPDPTIYESDAAWPARPAHWTGTSYRGNSTLVQLLVYPVRYTGAERRLEVCRSISVRVEYTPLGSSEVPLADGALDSVGFDYLIVTAAGYDTVFQRLADWKTRKGVKAVVRDIAWITSTYPGRDNAEKLRNYLKTVPDSGVRYVLLAGDVSVVPFRKAFAMNCEWGGHPREDSLPCDLYFADLDGDWDRNGNSVFGEPEDSIDLYADLKVGRAPVDRLVEARAFVNKVIGYERGQVAGYQNKALFFAEVLWQDPYTDQGVHKNKLEQQSFRTGYNITKLYQSLGNESRASVMNAIRQNQNFLNHDGHGWIDVMSCGSGPANYLRTADADTITNSGHGVLFSIGCWTTAFDFTSIGEAFVTNPNGGTIATIGNSSYGWGSPGNPGFGYSDKFDNRFWHAVTSEGLSRLGDALARAKEFYAPFSHDRNVYRWHQYQLNLMGDPELAVWTSLPQSLTVVAPPAIGLGRGRYLVTVARAGAPVPGALVCLYRPGEVYARARTDAAGRAWLEAETRTTGQLSLTVTAQNCYPYESSVTCDSGSCVNFAAWQVNDSTGNNDGIANPCETVLLPTLLVNSGNQSSGALEIRLRTANQYVTVLDSAAGCGAIQPGDSVLLAQAFRVAIA
ncbi:MAG: C25 family cysteine peptidase, partial [candidate division WOR-3 bacterium]